jgi:hypothetical protein
LPALEAGGADQDGDEVGGGASFGHHGLKPVLVIAASAGFPFDMLQTEVLEVPVSCSMALWFQCLLSTQSGPTLTPAIMPRDQRSG